MAGTTLYVEFDDAAVQAALDRIVSLPGSLKPLFADIGESLLASTRERASREVDPKGEHWAELSPKYRAIKTHKRPGLPMLRFDGHLLGDRLSYQPADDSVQVGSSAKYAAIQQFGGQTGRNHKAFIPPRPFLGISPADSDTILRKANRFIDLRLQGAI